jgi:hypothetical protein
MSDEPPESQPEELLAKWLAEHDEAKAEAIFSELSELHAKPVIRSVICRKLVGGTGGRNPSRLSDDVDDVCQDALSNIVKHLGTVKAGKQEKPLKFNGYVAVTAGNAYNEYFRVRYPARYSLANGLRYLLTHSPEFALWEMKDGQEATGTIAMNGEPPEADHAKLENIRQEAPKRPDQKLSEILFDVFRLAKTPLRFKNLLDIVAHCKGLQETESTWRSNDGLDRIPAKEPSAENGLVQRQYLEKLWTEICDLPLEQRGALLLNLKDAGSGVIQLFVWLGIATVRQIGEALEMTPERFAALWNELPLDDAHIALEMGMERQAVINRRSSARTRLANRMKDYEREK